MIILRKLFNRRSKEGKETQMTTTNPAAPGGLDHDALAKAVGGVLATVLPAAIAEAQKPILDQLGKLQAGATPPPVADKGGKPAAGAGDAPQYLTAADLTRVLDERDQRTQQSTQLRIQREAFQADKLKDLPPIYRNQLGNDPTKWAAEEQQIREQYKADFKLGGGKVEDVAGTTAKPGEPTLQTTIDSSKLSPLEKIEKGMAAAPAPATGTPAAGTGATPPAK